MKMKLLGVTAFFFVAVAAPASANTITYELVDATATFVANPSIGEMTSYTLNIDGTFTYDTTTLAATSVDITLSGAPVSPQIDNVLREYTKSPAGISFTGPAFSAVTNDNCCSVAISARFANPLDYSADPLVDFLYETSAGPTYAISVTGFADPTPLPAALPLFATGLGAMGLLGWRGKRKGRVV
jgi:hypothetical protein